jgi:peptidoglycan lytic transglycosylase
MLSRYRETIRAWTDPVGRALFHLHLRPNHLTIMGLGVSFVASAAFVVGRTRLGGFLVVLAGLFDFFDGSLARVSGQVTPFGAFLDSVIDRYSDLLVLLGIVVLFARMPNMRGAVAAMAALVGSLMVSYTKARAESIGIECNVGFMERPERMICLIAGALFDVLEIALWVLALLANITAVHRILFTRRAARATTVVTLLLVLGALVTPVAAENARRSGENVRPSGDDARVPDDVVARWRAAVEAFQQGDVAPLIAEFGQERALASSITDYVRWLLADALARRGDSADARRMAASIADRDKDSALAPSGLVMAATLAAQAGDDAEAQALIMRLVESFPDAPELPEALYLLGMIGEARGETDAAAHAYRELQVLVPTSGWADGAGDRLAELARAGVRIPELSVAQRLDRAERLLKGGVPQSASEEAERIAKEASEPSVTVRALRIVAAAAQRLGRYDAAARALDLAIKHATGAHKPALQLDAARALARTTKTKDRARALSLLATVMTTGTDVEAAEAAYQRARLLDEMGQETDAALAYRAVARDYPAREVAGASLWRLGWLSYLRGRMHEAAETWTRVGETPGGRLYRLPGLYWAGRATETIGTKKDAEHLWKRVLAEAPRSYYGVLAARRLSPSSNESPDETTPFALATGETTSQEGGITPDGKQRDGATRDEKKRDELPHGGASPERATREGMPRAPAAVLALPADPSEAIANDPGYARVDLLRRIGLVEFASQELEEVVRRSVGDAVRLYGLSSAYVRDERYHLALRILRRHFLALAMSGSSSLPQAFWEMLYPFGWRQTVTEAAEREGLDPFLVAALVREESSYYPRAVSPAGARGLMQLMPRTARLVAGHTGTPFEDATTLEDPSVNITLGTRFLAGMVKEFGDPRLALAAYNAGPKRVHQWWKARRTDDIEAFIEQIPFDETRGYVKRVMLSWEEYRRVYGGPSANALP